MNLDDFIRDTLVAIAKGITDANRQFGDVASFHLAPAAPDGTRHIDFEVKLEVEAKGTKGAGGGLRVWAADLHGSIAKATTDKNVHTVRFSVWAAEKRTFAKKE